MSKEKLTCKAAADKLSEYKGYSKGDALVAARIDHAKYIIERLTDDEVDKISSLKELVNQIDLAMNGEQSRLEDVNKRLEATLEDLKEVELADTYSAYAQNSEIKKYVKGKKKRKLVSTLFLVFLGLGAAATVIFAFLDNFGAIDYGGTAAGASGIIDLAIGVFAFIAERINDSKTTGGMQKADAIYEDCFNKMVVKGTTKISLPSGSSAKNVGNGLEVDGDLIIDLAAGNKTDKKDENNGKK